MANGTGSTHYPAPVGGLNDRDSLADMAPSDAVVLQNWWPYPSQVSIRKGSFNWNTGFSSPVETLVEYNAPLSTNVRLFGAAGANLYNVTNQGAIGAPVVTGQTNARWQDITISTPGGIFLYLVNGVDKALLYDGATWKSIDAASTPAITGVATTTLVQGTLFKNRLFFVQKDTLKMWYLPVSSIGGAASEFDLGAIFPRGGSLTALYTWTIDAGSGADDHLIAITSNGEIAVYQGTDPSTVATFSLIGIYRIGRPIGRRCGTKFGGDILIITEEGVYPLSKALISASIDRKDAITDKIQNSISHAVSLYKNNFGWQLQVYNEQNMLILNIPVGNGMNYQYAQNTITGAWTQFLSWNANCWIDSSLGLYYGDTISTRQAWVGNVDNATQIVADGLSSFQYFGSTVSNKYFTLVRPYLTTTGNPSILYGLNVNFTLSAPTGALTYTAPTGMVWGSMFWGSMFWGGSSTTIGDWRTVGAVANSGAIRLKVQGNGADVNWISSDYLYRRGGPL